MSSFNQYFKTKGAGLMVDRFLSGIDTNTDYKLTDMTWELVDEELPAIHYLENALTASFKVVVSYTVDNDGEVRTAEFEVPKEMDGAFIVEGSYRSAINTLGSDNECRFYLNKTSYGKRSILFDYDRAYYLDSEELVVRRTDPNLGLPEKVRSYKLSEIDKVSGLEREALRLTDKEIKKLQIKLDLDYTPEYITSKLINDCINYGDDRYKDSIIDKRIETVSQSFEEHLYNRKNQNLYKIRRYIINYWIKYKRLMESINMLTSTCIKFWKGSSSASKGESSLQSSGGVNAINMHTLSSKIKLAQSVAYNQSMSDLICVGDTPISQNVGLQNSLTVSTHLTEDGVEFDVYDTDFKKIRIPYIDYLNKKVCSSEFVDYDTKKMVPNENGEVEVKHRMRRKMVPIEEVELIDLHPDNRLSETARRIPFLNYTDSVRIHMGTAMLKQAIPLAEAERPLVDTGNYEELEDNVLNDKFAKDEGVVKEITEDEVIIELPNGKTSKMQRRSSIKSLNDVNVYSEPKVKVGQKVKRGDTILGAVGLEKDTYKSGLNALVLFHAMFGLVNEDAVVVSESFADRMRHYSLIDLSYDICYNAALKEILPIGTVVEKGDKILTAATTVELDEVNARLSKELGLLATGGEDGPLRDLSDFTRDRYLTVPNNIYEATISDVLIQENKDPYLPGSQKLPDLTYAHTSKDVIKSYDLDRKVIYNNFPEYIAADRLKPIDMNEKDYNVVYTVRIRLIMKTKLMKGSKLTNRYGGKGVISKILPDNQMPVMVDSMGKKKTVDIVMNPYSTVNRKIPGVNMENLLGNCAMKIHDLVDEWKDDPKKKEKIMPLVQKYYPGRYDDMTLDQFIKLHEKSKVSEVYYFNVGCYSKITPEQLDEWAKDLGVSSQYQILIPSNTVSDLEELKENLPEDEYKEVVKGMEGKYVPVNKPLTVGYMTMLELYHIPVYSCKVTSSMFDFDINEWKDSPIMGSGAYRTEGQKIDEMALNAILARGGANFIEEVRKDTYKEDNQMFLNNLLGLGLTITDRKGYNQGGSDLKNRLGEMKIKFRRKK